MTFVPRVVADPDAVELPVISRHAGSPKGTLFVLYAVGLAMIAVLAIWLWSRNGELRAVRALPASDRRALYERTLQTLQAVPCTPPQRAGELRDFCHEQAEFIVQFPECDGACSALAKQYLVSAAR